RALPARWRRAGRIRRSLARSPASSPSGCGDRDIPSRWDGPPHRETCGSSRPQGAGLQWAVQSSWRCPRRGVWSGAAEDADVLDGFRDAPEAAAVALHREARALHLARPALTAQLLDELEDLAQAGGPDRMALRFQPARRVDGDRTAEGGFAALGEHAAHAGLAQA